MSANSSFETRNLNANVIAAKGLSMPSKFFNREESYENESHCFFQHPGGPFLHAAGLFRRPGLERHSDVQL